MNGFEDLETWQLVSKFTNTTPTFGYSDSASASRTRRFYRVVVDQ